MTTFIFEPLMEEGKQVVRRLNGGEWFYDRNCRKFDDYDYEEFVKWCSAHVESASEHPVFILKRLDDPFKGLREVYAEYSDVVDRGGHPLCAKKMWKAISDFIREVR